MHPTTSLACRHRRAAVLGYAALAASALLTSQRTILASSFSWVTDADGTWGSALNWSPAVAPNALDASVTLGSVITAARAITLGQTYSVADLTFANANTYTLTGPGQLSFANAATLTAGVGVHSIAVPVSLPGTTTLTGAADLSFFANVTGSASSTFNKTGTGTVSFMGPTGALSSMANLNVDGGALRFDASAPSTATTLQIGRTVGTTGAVSIANGATLTLADLAIGGTKATQGGGGQFNLSSGSVAVSGTLRLWNTANTALNLSGGSLSVGSLNTSGNPSRFNWTGGGLTLTNSDLFIEPGNVLGGSLSLGPTQSLNVKSTSGAFFVGFGGTASVVQSGGTVSDKGLNIGYGAGSTGVYSLSGGSVSSSSNEFLGNSGTGSFVQTGGTHSVGNILYLGSAAGGTGSYTLSGSGVLAAAVEESIGHIGNGFFTQSGGVNSSAFVYIGLSGAGTYNLSGGTFTSSVVQYVGYVNTGAFDQSGGVNAPATLIIGAAVSGPAHGVGLYNLSGGTLAPTAGTYVGDAGTAVFNQTGGTHSAGSINVANKAGSTGSYTLSGTDARITTTGSIAVGVNGTGSFLQSAGTNAIGAYLTLANNAASTGSYTLAGASSVLTAYSATVGGAGRASFSQTGGSATFAGLDIASGAGGTATYDLSGTDTQLTVTIDENIGYNGSATFTQNGGTHTVNNVLILAREIGSRAAYTLDGPAPVLSVASQVVIGSRGDATFNHVTGTFNAAATYIAGLAGTTSSYTLSPAATLMVNGPLSVGLSGNGTFINNAGTNIINSPGNGLGVATSGGTGTYVLAGGTLTVNAGPNLGTDIGYSGVGSFIHTGGSHTTRSLGLGGRLDSVGVYSLSGASTLTVTDNALIGNLGAGSFVQTAGTVSIGGLFRMGTSAGPGTGFYSLSGTGSLSVASNASIGLLGNAGFYQSAGTVAFNFMEMGTSPGSTGIYSMSGASSLTVLGGEYIGNTGSGTFIQSGGTHSVGNSPLLGYQPGSTGTYSLSGTGVYTVNSPEYVGMAGRGSFIQSGGTHAVNGGLTVGYQSIASGSYVLSGGLLTASELAAGASYGPGEVTQSGGTAQIANALRLGGAVNESSTGSYSLTGGELSVNSITLYPRGTFDQTGGTLSVASEISLRGGTVRFTTAPTTPVVAVLGTSTLLPSAGVVTDNTLLSGNWNIASGATLSLSTPVTAIGPSAMVTLSGATSLFTALANLGTNAGSLTLDSRPWSFTPADNQFHNSGTLSRTGIASTSLPPSLTLDNSGIVTVGAGGTLSVAGPISQLSAGSLAGGTWCVAGSFLIGGSTISSSAATIFLSGPTASFPALAPLNNNAGSLSLDTGATLTLSQSLTNSGTVSIGAGSRGTIAGGLALVGSGAVSIAGDAASPGRLSVLGDISFPSTTATSAIATTPGALPGILDLGNAVRTLSVPDNTAAVDALISTQLAGSGITKTGAGTLLLSAANTYVGPTTVSAGTLRAGAAGAIPAASAVTVTTGATLDLGGSDQIVRSLAGGGLVTLGNASLNVRDDNAATATTFSGSLAGTGSFSKGGASTLVLSGSSSLAGPLSVKGGVLSVAGPNGALPAASAVLVDAASTLRLDSSAGNHATGDRVPDAAPVTVSGGTLQLVGAPATTTTEALGQLTLGAGAATIAASAGPGGSATLTFASAGPRDKAATVDFQGPDLGQTNRIFITGIPTDAAGFIGSWATVNATDFAKYDPDHGVIPFETSDYSVNVFAQDTHVRLDTTVAAPPVPTGVGNLTIKTLNLAATTADISLTQDTESVLTLSSGGLVKSGSFASTISGGTITSTSDALNISVDGGPLTISSQIAETAGTFILTKRGSGTLTLAGNAPSNYKGVTVVSGLLELDKPDGTNAIPGDLTVAGGTVRWLNNNQVADSSNVLLRAGTLDLNGFTDTVGTLKVEGGSLFFNHGTLTVTGGITLSGGQTVIASNLISGSFLTITGGDNQIGASGVVTVSGTTTFSGDSNPTVTIASGATAGRMTLGGDVVFDGSGGTAAILSTAPTAGQARGTLSLGNTTRTFTVGDGVAAVDMRVSAQVVSGALTKAGAGALRLESPNTYAGGTRLSEGTLEAANPQALGSGAVTFSSTATLALLSDSATDTFANDVTVSAATRDIAIRIDRVTPVNGSTTGTLSINALTLGKSLTLTGPSGGALRVAGPVTLLANATINNAVPLTFDAAVTGAFGLTKTQPGALTLAGAASNTYSGVTTVNAGVLQLAKPANTTAVAGNLTVNSNATARLLASNQIADSATVTLNASANAATFDIGTFTETIGALNFVAGGSVTGTGTLTLAGDSSFTGLAGAASITSNLTLAGTGPRKFTVADSADDVDMLISGTIAGAVGLTKDGPGRMNLTAANTFTGNVLVSGGILFVTTDAALGNPANAVTLDGGTLLSDQPISRPVSIGAKGATFNVPAANTLTVGLSGPGDVTKYGPGTLVANAGPSSFSGDITLAEGTLRGSDAALGGAASVLTFAGGTWASPGAPVSTARPISVSAGGGSVDATAGAFTLTGSANVTIGGALTFKSGAATINRSPGGTLSVLTGGSLVIAPAASLTFSGSPLTGADAPFLPVTNNGTLSVGNASNFAGLTGNGTLTVTPNGIVTVDSFRLPTINLTGTGRLATRAGAAVSTVNSLSIAPTAALDLVDGKLAYNYTGPTSPADAVRQLLLSGRGTGAWTGNGIRSSAAAANTSGALAWVEASQFLGLTGSATADWFGVTVDATTLLLRYTYSGDLNIDGRVNADDLALLDRGFARGLTGWINGDVNYDNTITAADFLLVDRAYALQGGPLSPSLLAERESQFGPGYVSSLIVSVPEPASLALIACSMAMLSGRRLRRH